jgi:hypothetical protein
MFLALRQAHGIELAGGHLDALAPRDIEDVVCDALAVDDVEFDWSIAGSLEGKGEQEA